MSLQCVLASNGTTAELELLVLFRCNCLSVVSLSESERGKPKAEVLFGSFLMRNVSHTHFLFFSSSALQGLLFVSSNSGLVEVPVANCSNYLSCGECVLSRDPYCAWTGRLCRDVRMAPPDRWGRSPGAVTFGFCLLLDEQTSHLHTFFKVHVLFPLKL